MILAHKIKVLVLLSLCLMCSVLSGCKDDLLFGEIGEGEAKVSCEINFVPLAGALGSRTSGTEIRGINSLTILIYDDNGKFVKSYTNETVDNWSYEEKGNTDMPAGGVNSSDTNKNPSYSDPQQAESATARAKFSFSLPYGRYFVYAVANVDLSSIDVEDINKVKELPLSWYPEDIAKNNGMFGFFTGADTESSIGGADKFDARLLVVNKPLTSFHSWLKRAASKVTIAYDGSGLHNDVRVYIKSVTLKNIPKTCFLGAENSPSGENSFYNPDENFLPKHDSATIPGAIEKVVDNSRMFYNNGIKGIDDNTDNIRDPGTEYAEWMQVINSGGDKGIYGSSHSETADALYFFENNQGDYDGDFKYDKRQYKGRDDNSVGQNIINPGQNDFRDKVLCGTYVEVQAYYVSNNPANYTSGPIRYRFMLGKNVTYNYNAERNHHFKLTLGFKGWANEPDWHIEYDEPEPSLIVPEVFRVSYVYNQRHILPIHVSGPCTGVEMEITKNYWAPCDNKGNILTDGGSIDDYDPLAFRWARSVFIGQHPNYATSANDIYNCTGFLALQVECDADGKIPTNIISNMRFSEGASAVNALNDYYTGKSSAPDQHKRIFSADNGDLDVKEHNGPQGPLNNYEVIENGDNGRTLLVPIFTRNKSMIDGTNYSGNNPFEEYDRYAQIKVTAHFKGLSDEVKFVNVLQTRRLVNPKGIWRSYDSNAAFHVQLATKEIGAGYSADYMPLQSDGSWKATIDDTEGNGFFKLKSITPGDTTKYVVTDADGKIASDGIGTVIIGKTDTFIDFIVDFVTGEPTASSTSNCGVITVLYHENQCVHKIMVRQGYNEPLDIMGNGVKWSSFSVFGATERTGTTDQFDVELTKNPLSLGSLIRRGRVTKAILVSNNGGTDVPATNFQEYPLPFGAYKPVNFNVGLAIYPYSEITDQQKKETWGEIGYDDERGSNAKSMGKFFSKVGAQDYIYRVPTFEDFKKLDNAEYAYGICYGEGADNTLMNPDEAFGFINPDNQVTSTKMGMRGVFVYNPHNGNQVFFPIGKYGIGRRRMFNIRDDNKPHTVVEDYRTRSWYGTLWYGDTNLPLKMTNGSNDWYRPMAYNVCYQRGAIYWIDKWVPTGGPKDENGNSTPSMGWDMNYHGFDFSPYTANNYQDACIIKLVVDE